ncbi:MAG: N-acetyltransferase [Thermodesulfovibrionales bacterium]
MKIIKVSSRSDLKDFIFLPFKLYRSDQKYIPPLLNEQKRRFSNKNPFYLHSKVNLYLVKKDGETVGRIASIINRNHNDYHKDKTGFFGFFESHNDLNIASCLFEQVIKDLKSEGLNTVVGPMNFSTNEECGFLLEGYEEPPMILMPYNFSYYHELLSSLGFEKAKDLYAFIYTLQERLPDKVYRVSSICEKKGVKVRYMNKKSFHRDLMDFKNIYNDAWADNWGFVPITDEEINFTSKELKPIANEELIAIAYADDLPVGFLGVIPDFNQVLRHLNGRLNPITILKALYHKKRISQGRLLLFGIRKRFRNRGIDALLYREVHKGLLKSGIKRIEFSWILEDNTDTINLAELFGGVLYKKYRIYSKKI